MSYWTRCICQECGFALGWCVCEKQGVKFPDGKLNIKKIEIHGGSHRILETDDDIRAFLGGEKSL